MHHGPWRLLRRTLLLNPANPPEFAESGLSLLPPSRNLHPRLRVVAAALANPLVEFNDSQVGVYLASVLHTLGAIGFLGGLVAYLAWHRHLAAQRHHHRNILEAAMVLSYLAIVVNLLGGFMRTFESDHPRLEQFAESPWVRAIAIKHVFLFAAMGAAVYLFEVVAPRLVKAHKAGTLEDASPTGHRVAVVLVALGIVVAAVLGAVTQVVPLVSASDHPGEEHQHGETVLHHNATGQLTSSPVAPSASTGGFDVPAGTVTLNATLTWTPAQTQLRLDLTAPDGQKVAAPNTAGGTLSVGREAPPTGSWTYSIASDLAVNVAWTLSLQLTTVPADHDFLAGSLTIPAGAFVEVNTEMEDGASLMWAWSTAAPVHFNVHSHFDGSEQNHLDQDAASGNGMFTDDREGGYSLLWENKGASPVHLDYRVWGEYTLVSTYPPS